jgi:hypothetical protein
MKLEEAHDLSSLLDCVDEMKEGEKTPAWRSGRGLEIGEGKEIGSAGGGRSVESKLRVQKVRYR